MVTLELLLLLMAGFLVFFLRQRGELNRIWGYRLLVIGLTSCFALLGRFFFPPFFYYMLQVVAVLPVLGICWQYWQIQPRVWWGGILFF